LWAAVEDMGHAGLLSADEQCRITIPIGLRTIEEIEAPFHPTGGFAGLYIERAELLRVTDPCWDEFEKTGDARAFAQSHADITRAWAGPTIARLIDPSRDQSDLVSDLFARFVDRLAARPRRHQPYMAVAVLAKANRPVKPVFTPGQPREST
jgi:hypothetical protein